MNTELDPNEPRRHSAAAERNQVAILAELRRLLPTHGRALEIASGTGQHVACFAAALPRWHWWPSDPEAGAVASIGAWCEGLPNVQAPLQFDVHAMPWPGVPATIDLLYCANMLHIAPWSTCAALMAGAARHLASAGRLVIYGPFIVEGFITAPSNLAFDADLRARNPAWGLRRLGEVEQAARTGDLHLVERIAMPANNLLLVFAREAGYA